jgi:nitrile hydratase subunit beta
VKLQHYIGGLEGLPEPLSLEPLSVEKRVFVEDWEKRIFGIHVAMMALSNQLVRAGSRPQPRARASPMPVPICMP